MAERPKPRPIDRSHIIGLNLPPAQEPVKDPHQATSPARVGSEIGKLFTGGATGIKTMSVDAMIGAKLRIHQYALSPTVIMDLKLVPDDYLLQVVLGRMPVIC